MKRLVSLAALVTILAAYQPAYADKASSVYKKGSDAEARQNLDEALNDYKQAADLKPKDARYKAAVIRIRFYAAAKHVRAGQQLRDAGKLDEALVEFQNAANIDPSSFIAVQELHRTEQAIDQAKRNGPRTAAPSAIEASPLAKLAKDAEGPVVLRPISNTPITLRMTEDTKVIYTTIGKLAGTNVLFDPDYTSRRITIDLNNVSLNQALEIVALESKTFWRPVTPNTIFVASDTPAKRKELEQSVVRTFYLGNVSTPNELQDAVNTVRQILDITRVQQIASQNAIVIRGTPDQVVLADKLLSDIDRAKPEVIVEVSVMQVNRNRARTIGINPVTSAQVQLQSNVTTTTNNSSTNSSGTTTTSTPTSSGSLTLNQLANLNATNFQVTMPAASLSFLANDADTKIIQNPQIRALDNQKATLKIGDRIPVATGSFQPGIGGVGVNPLVNTQFQYIDVGVNIDITPRIHPGGEVTLKMTLEISSVTGNTNIGGITQPTIGQRRIEHEIRLKEGETNLLGGILEDNEQTSLSGYPWVTKIPILKYLFGQDQKSSVQNEVVFAVTPHIVRNSNVSELNVRPIDVGTAGSIELRRPEETVPANGAAGEPQARRTQNPFPGLAPASQQQAATPAASTSISVPTPPGSLAAGNAVVSFEPANIVQPVGATFMVNLAMSGAQNIFSVPLQLKYDPAVLQLVNISNGGFLSKDGQTVALVHRDDPSAGTIQMTATRPPGSGGIAGTGPVFTVTFMAKQPGQSSISILHAGARDPGMQPISVASSQAMVTVK